MEQLLKDGRERRQLTVDGVAKQEYLEQEYLALCRKPHWIYPRQQARNVGWEVSGAVEDEHDGRATDMERGVLNQRLKSFLGKLLFWR